MSAGPGRTPDGAVSRIELERRFWESASGDLNLRNEWICDRNVADGPCVDLIASRIGHPSTAVELGCGIGRLTVPLVARFPACAFYGVDIAAGMIGHALTVVNVTYLVGDGRSIPLPDDSADAVYSMLLFQHLPAEGVRSYIAEAARVLRPGGMLVFQFIEGTEHEPFSHHHPLADVLGWVEDAAMEPVGMDRGAIDADWSWVTARRG